MGLQGGECDKGKEGEAREGWRQCLKRLPPCMLKEFKILSSREEGGGKMVASGDGIRSSSRA